MALGAVVAHSGLGDVLAHRLLAILPLAPGAEALNFAAMSMLGTLIGLATTLPGVPAVLTPLAADLSQATGWPLQTVLMAQVLGFSTVLFPYESGPLVVGTQLSGAGMAAALKLCLALAIVTIVFLLPLDFLWWRLLGEIG
ncbi:MAG: SLC13 family permease, partial [Ferrovibrionaceae bacterium]